jgi:hypothetical protein
MIIIAVRFHTFSVSGALCNFSRVNYFQSSPGALPIFQQRLNTQSQCGEKSCKGENSSPNFRLFLEV